MAAKPTFGECHRRVMRAKASLLAREYATELSRMALDEAKHKPHGSERLRTLNAQAKTAGDIAEAIHNLSLREEDDGSE